MVRNIKLYELNFIIIEYLSNLFGIASFRNRSRDKSNKVLCWLSIQARQTQQKSCIESFIHKLDLSFQIW